MRLDSSEQSHQLSMVLRYVHYYDYHCCCLLLTKTQKTKWMMIKMKEQLEEPLIVADLVLVLELVRKQVENAIQGFAMVLQVRMVYHYDGQMLLTMMIAETDCSLWKW